MAWAEVWEEAWEAGWEWEEGTWEEAWGGIWEVEWVEVWEDEGDGTMVECGKVAWTEIWEEAWEGGRGQEVGLGSSRATLVASKGASGQEEVTKVLPSGEVASSREEAEVSTEVAAGGSKRLLSKIFRKCTFMVTSWF